MKVRHAFISNSSSSSFVIMLPDNFNSEIFVEENKETILNECTDFGIFDDEEDEAIIIKKFTEKLKYIIKNKGEYFEDDENITGQVAQVFCNCKNIEPYIIASIDVSSEAGSLTIVDNNKIKEILKEK